MREIIINKTNDTRCFMLVDNGIVIEKYIDNLQSNRIEGNIYLGRVQNVLQGMQSAFINIGEKRNTFIHIKDLLPKVDIRTNTNNVNLQELNIKKYLKPGIPLLVQVKRESSDRKGPKVSTHINITGRFCVLMPNTNFITISQKIVDVQEKDRLIKIIQGELPENFGAIIRTSAKDKTAQEIKKDIKVLITKWYEIEQKSKQAESFPKLIYKNNELIKKFIIDIIDQDIDRIITNDEHSYNQIKNILSEIICKKEVESLLKKDNLLKMYDIDEQLNKIENRKIWLKCGGFITIDRTEALTAIDVNSCKYIGTTNLEKTAFLVNKEASIEIAKQLRLRDIGGIIIDYIDMQDKDNKRKIKEILEENLKIDRSKTQVLEFTKLNLLEMTRKHMYSS